MYAVKLKPGEVYVTRSEELIVTVLGSCVAACIRDKVNRIGGMNHFMLPLTKDERVIPSNAVSTAARFGNFAMEYLINNIIKNGGERRYLEVKLFGGAKVLNQMSDVGRKNIDFVLQYVRSEALTVLAKDLGGECPRKLIFNPITGLVRVKKLRNLHNDTIHRREKVYMKDVDKAKDSYGEIELFD
jgi:chemotaxis protein CheD